MAPAPVAPSWLTLARSFLGTREVVGSKHSPVIMGWIQEIGAKTLGLKVNDDETPWCGTFMALLMKRSGPDPHFRPSMRRWLVALQTICLAFILIGGAQQRGPDHCVVGH